MKTLHVPETMPAQTELPAHPESEAEYRHLQKTCDIIRDELALMEEELHTKDSENGDILIPEDPEVDDETLLNIFRIKVDRMRQLIFSAGQAYFARLDFIPDGGRKETHYLGRWGVMNSVDLTPAVVDWRSPVANLYYAGQLGRVHYEAPDGTVSGELNLKRMLTVSGRRLDGVFDTDIVSRDKYLQDVLGSVSGDRLKEIVTTIQAEQNLVIRHPLRQDLLVQGAAGSGKTTIALHRIAYLLYTWRDTLRSERLMILAPNPLFLSYISQVLPDLGVERVIQTTFQGWCDRQMSRERLKVRAVHRLEDKLTMEPEEQARIGDVLRQKGSLDMMHRVDTFLDVWQREILPEDGLVLSGVRLYTKEELETVFLTHLKHFPLADRIKELKKYIRKRLNDLCERMRAELREETERRLEQLMTRMPDGEKRRELAGRLLDARDQRLVAIERKATDYLSGFASLFPDFQLLHVYRAFLEHCDLEAVRDATLPDLENGLVRSEDLAILCHLYRGIHGIPAGGLQHIVIDECQDFSPYQLALLKRVYPAATLTAVGDLMQGIHAEEGIRSWQEWTEPVFHGAAAFRQLVVSYRNTVEIMQAAMKVATRYPIPDTVPARPVLRHGEPVRLVVTHGAREREEEILLQATCWQQEGYHTIALIEKTAKEADSLYRRLKKKLPVRLLTEKDTEYAGGLLVIPASLVKGMEFDCVLICNAGAEAFPDDEFLSRVLYVMMTRPLHRLTILAENELSPLLTDIQ